MRFYTTTHQHDRGIDLHAKTMDLCILDREGQVLLHRNVQSRPDEFLAAVAPYRDDLVVAVECMFTWYWLADLCRSEGIAFVLGHALCMKAIHGAKAKNDKVDAWKIASLLRGGNLPQAYVYPPEMSPSCASYSTPSTACSKGTTTSMERSSSMRTLDGRRSIQRIGARLPAATCRTACGRLVAPQTTTGPRTPTQQLST